MTQPHPTPPERFAILLQLLQRAVAACHKDGLMAAPLIVLIWKRLANMAQRFARLATRIQAGTYRPRRTFTRRPAETPKPRAESPFPKEFGWLLPLVPWVPMRQFWGGPAHGSLRQLLNDPEMQALIAVAPAEMGRILRPLCWMLGLKPPPILARPRRRAAKAGAPPAPPAQPPPPPARSRPPKPPMSAPPPVATAPADRPSPPAAAAPARDPKNPA